MKRLALILISLAAAGSLTGCFQQKDVHKEGLTEGVYVETGGLKYQVQISRILNPSDPEDKSYIAGIANPLEGQLGKDEEWFGVFVRVMYEEDEGPARRSAAEFKITDTVGKVFEPVKQNADDNPLVYQPIEMVPKQLEPDPESVARFGPTQGNLLLFKIPRANLENRPLELEVEGGADGPAQINLDI